jgi:predicted DNA-binding transcriptional regulator AlpA
MLGSMEGYLDADGVAAMAGVDVDTIWRYHSDGRIPPADEYVGKRSPVWREQTITTWLANLDPAYPRPGKAWRRGVKAQPREDATTHD